MLILGHGCFMIVIVFLCSKARLKLLRAHTSLLFQTQRRKKNTKNTKIFRVGRWTDCVLSY